MRDNAILGPAEVTSSLTVSTQAHPTANPRLSLQPGDTVRFNGELSSI
jgi:hypothetical protein